MGQSNHTPETQASTQTPSQLCSVVSQEIQKLLNLASYANQHVNVTELMDGLVQSLAAMAPASRIVVALLGDKEKSEVRIMHDSAPAEGIEQTHIQEAASALFNTQVDQTVQYTQWRETGHRFGRVDSEVLVAGCQLSNNRKILFFVFRTNGAAEYDSNMLGLFISCASSALNSMYLVKSLQRANQLLRESTTKVANLETLAALSDMTSGVAHDFNNIFGALIGRIELMKLRLTDQKTQTDLRSMEGMILEGAETVRRIQEFTSSARYKSVDQVDLVQIVSSVLNDRNANWFVTATQKQQTIVKDVSMDSATINGNAADLMTALEKLIQNAVDFSPEGATIRISLIEDRGSYSIKVQDAGTGIPKELQKKVFYPFYTTKGSRGAGLGLAIVHGVAVRHGGTIGVESILGVGSVFTLAIPKAEKTEDSSDFSKVVRETKSLKILVVDDDDQIRGVLCDMLSLESHTTVACPDGASALVACANESFDLVLTDLGMPGMSGLELADRIHRDLPQLPIAMITGWGTQLSQDEIAAKGIRTVLSKPFHMKDIKTLLEDVLHSR